MKKKIIAAFAAAAVLLTAGCGGSETAQTTAAVQENQPAQTTTAPVNDTDDNDAADSEEEYNTEEEIDDVERSVSGFALSVKGSDGKMKISRAAKKSTSMGDADTWTIFIYLCGTDLESGQASATEDIVQMTEAQENENVRFVFQTGGTEQWQNEIISTDACERYVVENGNITLVDSAPLTNMGDPSTLEGFLDWGVQNYPAEKMGFIFWDHGGGSITGACVDELNEGDTLYLSEMNTAFSKVYENMTDKFEFIGFDCCLMGTAETANVLSTYARYFYGSQETEPGTGWDYTAIGNFLAEDPSVDGAALGKVVADSFYDECALLEQENECTFTIIDCEKFDDFAVVFNDYAKELYEAAGSGLAGIVRGVNKADNFGGNDKSEGFTNMVDIGGIVNNCAAYADGSAVLAALDDCIVYNRNGSLHTGASGLSVYYPLQVEGSEELKTFGGICISPYYLSLVDMIAKGYTGNGYDNQVFFTEDGDWSNEDCDCESYDDSYFDNESYGESGESSLITFAEKPGFNDEDYYGFVLDENGLNYTADVSAMILMDLGDGTLLVLGETYDVYTDWDNGYFSDNFDGKWLSLPDGSLLSMYIVEAGDDSTVYTSPIELNGKRTNLRIVQSGDSVKIEGAWDGIDENGMAAREVRKLKAGDKIAPIYYILGDDDSDSTYTADAYEWADGDNVIYAQLPNGDYYYAFSIDDVYGDYYLTDPVVFTVSDDGISFSELE
ncbi:MAG: hypothetical protein IJ784_07145 [Ruminiclostridium sp.]|nr:hypothetical protein [Ruminiclostridium sp.]